MKRLEQEGWPKLDFLSQKKKDMGYGASITSTFQLNILVG